MRAQVRGSARWPFRLTVAALVGWGTIHVLGGITLLVGNVVDGLETLGPDAKDTVPTVPGEATEGLLRFHALNVLIGGIAVLALTAMWWHRPSSRSLEAAVAVAVALDLGLLAFLVLPGTLPPSQGLIGPVLMAVAGVAAVLTRRADTSHELSGSG